MSTTKNNRVLSIIGFSFLSAYLLSFIFEGRVLYSIMSNYDINPSIYVVSAIVAHFIGLFCSGLFIKSAQKSKQFMIIAMGICFVITIPFFFNNSILWGISLIVGGFVGGIAVASWGYFLKEFTPKNHRIKTCADVLIYSNIIMIVINVVAINLSAFIGLIMSVFCLIVGIISISKIEVDTNHIWSDNTQPKESNDLKKSLVMLFIFVAGITINSGLMYQVINPAFEHLTGLVSLYWAVPYIVAILLMRNSKRAKSSYILYLGMAMIVFSFISFMLLGRNSMDYIIVNTLMLGACGIFDLFWWSIIGEILEYSSNPVKVFGIGLSANVFGVLSGDLIGIGVSSMGLQDSEITVIALVVICLTLALLPSLNRQLSLLIKEHVYLTTYDNMSRSKKTDIIQKTKVLAPLTERESEVLGLILAGKSNREISEELFISESTVKTHVRNIYSKYDVSKRAELISMLLSKGVQ